MANGTPSLPLLDEPKAGRLNIQYSPHAGTVIAENPPRFTWLPMIEAEAQYVLRISTDPKFPAGKTTRYEGLPLNLFTPDTPLDAGEYHWSYAVWSPSDKAPASTWSQTRSFTLADGLPQTPLASRATRYKKAEMAHPRLWLSPQLLKNFQKDLAKDPTHCSWDVFFEKSVAPWMERDLITEPAGYPDHSMMTCRTQNVTRCARPCWPAPARLRITSSNTPISTSSPLTATRCGRSRRC